ncbi:Glutamate-tRNA ligase cytoplasmic [Spathaspora sp. JA1]|nr:Glutamate-tRNA ligase cytoplasmic [Spathaspora sp. JA1]
MSISLSIAAKAQFLAYPVLIAVGLINDSNDSIPIEVLDVKQINDVSFKLVTPTETFIEQDRALEFLSQQFPEILRNSEVSSTWVKFAIDKLYVKNFKVLSADLEQLDAYLNFRSFISGYNYTIADYAIWGVLRANGLMGSILKNKVYPNVSRFYTFIGLDSRLESQVEFVTKSVNDLRKAAKEVETGGKKETHKANFEIDLKNAEMGKVVTRFPPEPSGYLHIGHAKAAILNEYFAHKYKGKLIIRFDDTNPTKEKQEFQDSIIEDLALLGVKGDVVSYSSDYFDQMYELAVKMIKEGKAYCDDTPLEKMREQRMVGEPSERRERTVEENLQIFTEEMKNGTEIGLKNCVRAKIDYTAKNKTLRDPVIYRCNLTPHHRTGTTWKMYPTYDFCAPVVDSIEGVTHALRTNEYHDRNAQYEWILNAVGLRQVSIWDFGRVNFMRTLLSKRKLQWFVDKHYVGNWDDPRFPTIRGVRRRGMTVEALRNFILAQGPSKNIINLDWSVFWALNKKVVDPIAPRFTAIERENAVVVNLDRPIDPYTEAKPKHKKNSDIGSKSVIFTNRVLIEQADAKELDDNEEVTFMDWGNVIVTKVHKTGDVVSSIDAKLNLQGDFRKTSKKLTWLADTDDKIEVELVDFDHLITKDKLEEGDDFENFLTPQTEFHTPAFADLNVAKLKVDDVIQFERKGYYRVDRAYEEGKPAVLFTIPDGKTVSKYGSKK